MHFVYKKKYCIFIISLRVYFIAFDHYWKINFWKFPYISWAAFFSRSTCPFECKLVFYFEHSECNNVKVRRAEHLEVEFSKLIHSALYWFQWTCRVLVIKLRWCYFPHQVAMVAHTRKQITCNAQTQIWNQNNSPWYCGTSATSISFSNARWLSYTTIVGYV